MPAQPGPYVPQPPHFRIVSLISCTLLILHLGAGCITWDGGRNTFDQDITVQKLDPDGLVIWTKEINSGQYDYLLDFIETPDGGFLIVGGSSEIRCGNYPPPHPHTPRLTRLSVDGKVIWNRAYSAPIKAVARNPGGGFSGVTDAGEIIILDDAGNITRTIDPGLIRNNPASWPDIRSICALDHGGYLIAGRTVARVDSDGNLVWHQFNETIIGETFALAEIGDTNSSLVLIYDVRKVTPAFFLLDGHGSILNETLTQPIMHTPLHPRFVKKSPGYVILANEQEDFPVAYHFDPSGTLLQNVSLVNLSHSMQNKYVIAQDGTIVALEILSPGNIMKRTVTDTDGVIISGKRTTCYPEKLCSSLAGEFIPTSDGGFGTIMTTTSRQACWS